MTVGTVSKVYSKTVSTKRGPGKVFSMLIDGTWYSCGFDNPTKYGITDGAVIEYEPDSDEYGAKVDLKSISVKTSGSGAAPTTTGSKSAAKSGSYGTGRDVGFPIPSTNYQISIIRQHAITQARELISNFSDNFGINMYHKEDEEGIVVHPATKGTEVLSLLFDIAGQIADYTSGRVIEERLKKLTDEME